MKFIISTLIFVTGSFAQAQALVACDHEISLEKINCMPQQDGLITKIEMGKRKGDVVLTTANGLTLKVLGGISTEAFMPTFQYVTGIKSEKGGIEVFGKLDIFPEYCESNNMNLWENMNGFEAVRFTPENNTISTQKFICTLE